MDVISESLRRATDAAPPTRIDVDALIAGERRRRRVLIGGSALSAAAAGTVAVLLVGQALTGPGRAGPSPGQSVGGPAACIPLTPSLSVPAGGPNGTKASPDPSARPPWNPGTNTAGPSAVPSPEPTPDSEAMLTADKHRLSEAFAAALRSAMPGVPFTDWADKVCPLPQVVTFDPAFAYEMSVVVTDGQGRGDIVVHLYAASQRRPSCGDCGWKQDLPDGGLAWGQLDDPTRVDIWRPDGTGTMILAVDHKGDPKRTTPPATRTQMIAIGDYPALSMYPR
jgi:hypothetical protein